MERQIFSETEKLFIVHQVVKNKEILENKFLLCGKLTYSPKCLTNNIDSLLIIRESEDWLYFLKWHERSKK